jgi:UDP-N-acetylglucosamine 2-epimerase (non-hydrolysing)
MSVVGARPQFVKLAPIDAAIRAGGQHEHLVVHTGQHYDALMSDVFFEDLGIAPPDVHLNVGSASHGRQTGLMLEALEGVFEEHRPDWVLVYGDTNSTLAAAVAAVKIHQPLAHLEAGLRSRNRRMPEEHNRVLTDHASDLLLAPTALAAENLAAEGLADRTVVVGDVMADVCLQVAASTRPGLVDHLGRLGLTGDYVVATIHRAENTDDPVRLRAIVDALGATPARVVLAAHPRLVARAAEFGIPLTGRTDSLTACDPWPYPDLVAAVLGSRGIVTDSGGLQKEAYLLGRPCTTVRTETEWQETLEGGWNILDPEAERLAQLASRPAPPTPTGQPYGSGDAAYRVVAALESAYGSTSRT